MADWGAELDAYIDAIADDLRDTRRHLHAYPEPSREEYRTTKFLAGRLDEVGIPHQVTPSGRGLIAGPDYDDPRPRVAFRADIDALHIHDLKDVSYRSKVDGVMHACGHDAHATMALGAAMALWERRARLPWDVPWRAIFQPAEETGEGAVEMIAAGAVDGVRAVVALHVDPELLVGCVAQRTGVMTAFCQDLKVVVRGEGGHAARPHLTTDPIALAVQFITAAYQLIPRSVDSREASVVTFGAIHGGTNANVIPDRVELLGTVRTLNQRTAATVAARLRCIAQGLSEASGGAIEVTLDHVVDAVVNDVTVTAVCTAAAAEVVGACHVLAIPLPSMGGEDFASYLAYAPGCLLRLGVAALDDRVRHCLHSPSFDIDERALAIGAKILARSMIKLCEPQGPAP